MLLNGPLVKLLIQSAKKTSVSRDTGSATSRSVDSISPCICIPRSKMTNRPPYGLVDEKIWKNADDLHDLDFDLVTLRSPGYVNLDYTCLWCDFGEDRRSLRLSKANFKVWPLTSFIWPWGQKFKIPPHEISAYGPKEHFYAFSALSYQNCGTSSKKYEKMHKNDQFITRTSWTAYQTTSRPMPGRYF